MPPETVEPKPEVAPREPPEALPPIEPSLLEVSMEPAAPEVPSEPALEELEDLELHEDMTLPEAQPVPPNPVPRPEPPLPLPQPEPAPGPVPEPEPEPGPGPEDAFVDPSQRAELEEARRALETERADAEAFVRSRTEDLLSKEELLFARERAIVSKEEQVEAHARAATERLAELEKDSARREVLRFLGAIPGMSASQADVIATAFPDIVSLTAADEKALTQCKGVADALARAIRLELAPGELEEERRSSRLREEAQASVEVTRRRAEGGTAAERRSSERSRPAVSCNPRSRSGRPARHPRARGHVHRPRGCGRRRGAVHARTREGPAERAHPLSKRRAPRAQRPLGRGDSVLQPRDRPSMELPGTITREGRDPPESRSPYGGPRVLREGGLL